MTDYLLALIAAHIACSDISETRPMTMHEMAVCGAVYQDIKLEFVPGMDRRRFATLSSDAKADVNLAGFLAFHEWRTTHPNMIDHLKDVARGKVKLAVSS